MPYKKTSLFTDARSARAHARQRGAAFLEAIVVISALTLGLLALIYVRDLYVKQLGAARLARAAVIAHSMAGCKTNEPRDWLGRDLAGYTLQGSSQDQQSARGKNDGNMSLATSSGQAQRLLQRSGATSEDGEGLLNPITDAALSGRAKATDKSPAGVERSQPGFSGAVRAKSFVSCGDEVKDGDFDRILGVVKDDISNLLGR